VIYWTLKTTDNGNAEVKETFAGCTTYLLNCCDLMPNMNIEAAID
jgi:hypothetical protein